MPNYDLITILGPTASGKTPFAAALAYELNTEIISADSRQIYRGMDLGTGKDLADYTVNGHKIPYHLIDIAAPGYKYNVFEYQQDFLVSYETASADSRTASACPTGPNPSTSTSAPHRVRVRCCSRMPMQPSAVGMALYTASSGRAK